MNLQYFGPHAPHMQPDEFDEDVRRMARTGELLIGAAMTVLLTVALGVFMVVWLCL